jgi:FKBP-type peptidyl-prolyl cis-trans isomerase FkpA
MRIRKIALYILCISIGFTACKKNDTPKTVEDRDRTEQQIIDNDSIIGYLETHYYNSADFGVSNPNPSLNDLVITELPEGETVPVGNTLLIDAVETKSVVFAETDYEFYILKLNQGGGDSPTFADRVRVNYEGRLLNETIFDSTSNPVTFDLLGLVPGWSKAMPYFSTAEGFNDIGDGTISFYNYGLGMMFLPSGLGYFSSATTSISSYSPLIFKIELLQMLQNDDDGDGIPSFMEDLNGDGEFTLAGDDTDLDNIPNYADVDDDGDGVLTKDEIVLTTFTEDTKEAIESLPLESNQVLIKIKKEANGKFTGTVITFTDTDSDGIPDYLDKV